MWFKWLLIALLAIEAIGYVLRVGRARERVTPIEAASEVVTNALLILGLLHYWR